MNSNSLPQSNSLLPSTTPVFPFDLGPGLWSQVPLTRQAELLHQHLQRAHKIILESGLPAPHPIRLNWIVTAASEAEFTLRATATQELSKEDCDSFFAEFITRALQARIL